MAYTKITPIKSGTHIENALDYIENPLKTDGQLLVSSYMCSYKNAFSEFADIAQFAMKKGNNIAHHIVQSFSPEDNISPEQAIEIGRELMERMYPNHQYVIATHIDKGHIHNHIIVNAVDFVKYKKINSNKESLAEMRKISDDLCAENGLTVIEPTSHSQRKKLTDDIDEAIKNVSNFEEFLGYMQEKKYELKQGKSYSFRAADGGNFLRLSSLGSAYSERNIRKRIEENAEIPNKKRYVFDNKAIRTSKNKRLKTVIDNALKRAKDYDDFIDIMDREGYIVKQGKHLAFKSKKGEKNKFLRCDKYGDDYSEFMLRLRFDDPDMYKQIKEQQAAEYIGRVKTGGNRSRKVVQQNITADIKTLEFLMKNNIQSYEELEKRIIDLIEKSNEESKKISGIKSEISTKYDIINSSRIYWQYKPLADEARHITDKEKRAEFMQQHKEQMDKFKKAIDIMNSAKEKYGKLPSSEQLHMEIDKLNEQNEDFIAENNKIKRQIKLLENVRYNLEMVGVSTERKAKKNIDKSL